MLIYGMPSYQLGADTEPDTATAQSALRGMRRSLTGWLKYRQINDDVAAGKKRAKYPAATAKVMLMQNRDWAGEQKIANQLHALLSEVFDAAELPSADVKKDPNAAVRLAKIAISGKLPSETNAPQAQGLIWLWPLVVVAGLVAFTITSYVSTQAEVQKDKEHKECIQSGACTDYGFWLKVASIGVVGYLVWDRLGIGSKLKGAKK